MATPPSSDPGFWESSVRNLAWTLILWMGFLPATAQSIDEEEERLQELEKAVEELEAEYERYQQAYAQLRTEQELVSPERALLPSINRFRLTTQNNIPVTVNNRNNQATLYLVPYNGNEISLYYRGAWRLFQSNSVSLSLATTVADSLYDVFAYRDAAGAITLELSAAWTGDHTRTDALALQDGIYVKSSDHTRRYLGTLLADAAGGQLDDNLTNRGLWNYYNRVPRVARRFDGSNQWNYAVNAWRVAGNDAANEVVYVVGINETLVRAFAKTNNISPNVTERAFAIGIGLNTQSASSSLLTGTNANTSNATAIQAWTEYKGYPGIGLQRAAWIEISPSAANARSWGDHNASDSVRSGIGIFYEG